MRCTHHPVTGRKLDWCESGVCDWCHCPSKNPGDMVVASVDGEVHEFCDDECLYGFMKETSYANTQNTQNTKNAKIPGRRL